MKEGKKPEYPEKTLTTSFRKCHIGLLKPEDSSSSSSRSSNGNSSLPDEGGSASQVPQASVQLAGYRSVVWPDSLSEWLVGGAELQ